jgi:hypothetical protein
MMSEPTKPPENELLWPNDEKELEQCADEPPVVARMVIEIRSDGSRTIARGAVEDTASGERVAIEAKGSTPAALAASLAKSLFSMPVLARQAVRALLAKGTRRARSGTGSR